MGRNFPVSVTLNNLVSQFFGQETKERKLDMDGLNGTQNEHELSYLPLFVLFTLFPGENIRLNVFEPRYRLMIRRVSFEDCLLKFGFLMSRSWKAVDASE